MFDEITRLLNTCCGWAHMDSTSARCRVLYAFREREDLMDMYEAVSGARCMRPTTVRAVSIRLPTDAAVQGHK